MSDPYIQGFNAGYMIAEHLPELGDGISMIESALPWVEGFRHGRVRYLLESTDAWLEESREKARQRNPIQERDGDVEY